MAVSSVPLDLSADSTSGTVIELRWTTPESDGGETITGYFIERNLNDAGFATLVADTATTATSHTDSTLSAQDNAVYRVSAINGSGTSAASDTASATTATSESQTITELLSTNWALTGELSSTSVLGAMNEAVQFYDRGQIPGNKVAKAVTVQKINTLGNEMVVEHPQFFEQSDIFEITCFLQIPDGARDNFSVWIDLMQQMTSEVTRILKTVYSPSANTGEFFVTNSSWSRDDTFFPDDAMLVRTLRFNLTKIVSNDDEVFSGFGGVLAFDTSASTGDLLPASDYTFAQVTNIRRTEGYVQIPILTKDKSNGVGVPRYVRGMFNGEFTAKMFAKKTDIIGSTTEKLENIYKVQSDSPLINQNAEVGFLQTNANTETIPFTLTQQSVMKIDRITEISSTEELVTFDIHGVLTKLTEYSVA